ncbi:MAG: esterase/lipase family protein [Gammaproteobacteria bacterium]
MNRHHGFSWFPNGVAAVLALGFALLAPNHALAAAGTATLSDPVPVLLNGSRVTTDVTRLAVGARPVQGVAADGVSEIVVAVTADTAGQQFTFTVYNDQSAPSASTAADGALAAVGSTDFDHGQLVTTTVTTNLGAMAFVIYRAPLDFARPGGGDDALASRAVSIHWSLAGGSQSGTIPLTVLRPPVVLIHGLWSDPATWSNFTPLLGDDRFSIYRANYGSLVQSAVSTTPSGGGSSISANALGFAFNARYVAPQIDSFVNSFKTGRNPASLPVADVQADIVAHSMGGNITRTMPLMPGFASATSFARGNVHKLITIDTPHLGSPLGIDLLPADGKDPNSCVRGLFSYGGLNALLSVETPAGVSINGAMGDLQGDGSGGALSPALQAMLSSSTNPPLQTSLLPTAFVAAISGPTQLGGLDYCRAHVRDNPQPPQCKKYVLLYALCSTAPLVMNMTSAGWENNVMMGPSDSLVPFPSEYNNYAYAPVPLTAIHSASLEELGLVGPGVLQSVAGAPPDVIALLNTWIADSPPFVGLR